MNTQPPLAPCPADRITVGSDELTFRVSSKATAGTLLAIDVRMAPGGGPPMLHRHEAVEIYNVQHGEFTIYLEDDRGEIARIVAAPDSVVAIPGGREHTIRNESQAEAIAYVVFAPGSAIEGFTRAADALAARDSATPADVLALAERHGIEMTRPVPSDMLEPTHRAR